MTQAPDKVHLSWGHVQDLLNPIVDHVLLLHKEKYPEQRSMPIYITGVPRGGVYVALLLCSRLQEHGVVALMDPAAVGTSTPFIIVDDIIDSGATQERYEKLWPGIPFRALVHEGNHEKVFGKKWIVFPWEEIADEQGPEHNITRIMEYIGDDPSREGLVETPKRVIRSFDTLYGGYNQKPQDIMKVFKEDTCDELVLLKNIEFYSTCEHHMLPFFGKAHIAYVPDGKVLGVSKLARLLEIYARRLQIQERIGEQVTNALMEYLNPKGAACILEATHFCMTSRGVQKQNSVMCTSSLEGVFRTNQETRNELLHMVKG